jgi:hypothetical protein
MTAIRLALPFALLALACRPVLSYANVDVAQTARPVACTPDVVASAGAPDSPPTCDRSRITVGVSDPNAQLILPWFLSDIVNAINLHYSSEDFVRSIVVDSNE